MEHKVEVSDQPELVELFTRCLGDPGKRRTVFDRLEEK
jgi:hypothetical protein